MMKLIPSKEQEEKIIGIKEDGEYIDDPEKIMLLKSFFIIFFIAIYIKTILIIKNNKEQDKKYNYFFCFSALGKAENIYGRETFDYYKKLGVEKFFIADNNAKNAERFSDLFQKEIIEGSLEVMDVTGGPYDQTGFYGEIYQMFKSECRWMSFFDFDEYLVINESGKNLTIPQYLSNKKFEKCDVVLINWLMYSDNNLIRYENKSLNERFTDPLYHSVDNRFVKSIVRGNLRFNPWGYNVTPHRPQFHLRTCDAHGERAKTFNDVLKPPRLNGIYIKHFATKSAEEYINKVKRGHPGSRVLVFDERIDNYFKINNVTEEKVKFFEEQLNMSFPKYHYIFKNK